MATFAQDCLTWVEILLVFGGIVTTMAGIIWDKTARLLRFFFEAKANPDKGFVILLVGAGMALAGFGLIYFLPH